MCVCKDEIDDGETLLGIIALPPLRSATPKVFGLPFLTFEESAGSFDRKQVGDALRAAVNGTLAATVPFSRCRCVLTLWLVELVTNRSAKNSKETPLLRKKNNDRSPGDSGGETVVERPVVVWCRRQPLRNIQSREK